MNPAQLAEAALKMMKIEEERANERKLSQLKQFKSDVSHFKNVCVFVNLVAGRLHDHYR